jgi:hypothetical protein
MKKVSYKKIDGKLWKYTWDEELEEYSPSRVYKKGNKSLEQKLNKLMRGN